MTFDPATWPDLLLAILWLILAVFGFAIPLVRKIFDTKVNFGNIIGYLSFTCGIVKIGDPVHGWITTAADAIPNGIHAAITAFIGAF